MKRIIFCVLFSILLTNLSAQKVGVVLSGGGAKGVTHIGVLKALEEAGIPIDYIAGTSMGAIIGGLYASGYSPDDMINIINSDKFNNWVSGKLDPEYIYFFRQPYPNASWFNFKFKIDSTIQTRIPTNIVSPVRMDFAFLELFSQASAVAKYNYDSLMIPFRCVASDIRVSKPYFMHKGDLGSSIRASMTFPFYFKPIRIDGRLLFDGGMYNNFPSDIVMKDFFPDIIIGSKAAGNYNPPEEDNVVSQLTSMLMNETDYDVYCDASILIEPKLWPTNLTDFSHSQTFIDSGYVATMRAIPHIRQFVLDTVTLAMHNQIRSRFNNRKPEILINTIQVNGLQQGQSSYVVNAIMGARAIKNKKGSHSYDLSVEQVKKGYFKILGENRLKSAFPTLVYDPKSERYKFVIDAKYDNTIMAEFGGSLSSGATNEIFLQLKYNHWRKIAASASVNGYFGRFYNSAYVGASTEIPGSRPLTFETSFTFNQFNYFRTNTYFFIDKSPAYLAQNETYGRSALGLPMGNKSRFELGITYGRNRDDYFQTNEYTREDTLDKTILEYYSPYFQIEKNTLNRKQYSNMGMRFYTSVHYINGNEEQYPGSTSLLKGDYTKHHDYITFNLSYEAYFAKRFFYKPGISIDLQINTLQNIRNFTSALLLLPAYTPVYEMLTQFQPEYRATGFASFGFRNVFTLYKNLDLRLEGYIFAPLREVMSDSYRRAIYSDLFPSMKYIASGCLVYQTPLGPLSVSLNKYNDDSLISFFVNLGYIIFNRSAIR